jgi:nitroreductase
MPSSIVSYAGGNMTTTTSNALAVKPAITKSNIQPLLRKRWSARSFSDQKIEIELLEQLFEAASWAPSSMNEQPWRYIVTRRDQDENFEPLWNCLMSGNQPWTQRAPLLLVSVAEQLHKSNGAANKYAMYDVGAANQSLLLQAASMGILGHLMGGFHADQVHHLFQLPESMMAVVVIALGYPDMPDKLEEPFYTREITPRVRKPLAEIVHWNGL